MLSEFEYDRTVSTGRTALGVTVKLIAQLPVLISSSLSRTSSTCPEEVEVVDEAVGVEDSVERGGSARTIYRPWASRLQTYRLCLVRRAHYIPYVVFRHR